MTIIHTMEDLIQVLDENPEWLEALRARLLTRELLEMPQTFAKFVAEMYEFRAEMYRFVEATNKQFEAIDRRFEAIDRRFEAVDRRFEAIDKRFEAIDKRFEAIDKRFEAIDKRFDEHTARLDSLDGSVQKLRNDMGPLKGGYARNAAIANAALIARKMGLRRSKTLSQEDLLDLTDAADIAGIPSNQIDSFHLADLVMEAMDQEREPCYIAMEISFTVNGRDTARAIRNAEFLTKFSGKRAYAAVAGLYRDNHILPPIESGQVFWYQLSLRDMEAE